jgi:flagellar biosynthesis/type III secretory pathway protein FliH
MRSSTNVIKSNSRRKASSWDPSELETLAPIHDPMLNETASHTNIKTGSNSPVYAAREQAEDILADAHKKAEAVLQEAREQGYREGREAVEQELIDAAAAVRTMAEETKHWQAEMVSSANPRS